MALKGCFAAEIDGFPGAVGLRVDLDAVSIPDCGTATIDVNESVTSAGSHPVSGEIDQDCAFVGSLTFQRWHGGG